MNTRLRVASFKVHICVVANVTTTRSKPFLTLPYNVRTGMQCQKRATHVLTSNVEAVDTVEERTMNFVVSSLETLLRKPMKVLFDNVIEKLLESLLEVSEVSPVEMSHSYDRGGYVHMTPISGPLNQPILILE